MGLFGALRRLSGKVPPRIPSGAVLRLEDDQPLGSLGRRSTVWYWAYTMPGEDPDLVANQKRVGPEFTDLAKAQQYGDFLKSQGGFDYGMGAV